MPSPAWARPIRRSILAAVTPARNLSHLSSSSPSPVRRFAALWGNGDYGRLGHGGLESKWTPTACSFFAGKCDDDPLCSIACGGAHTLFLTDNGRVFATGLNDFGQLGINSTESHILEPVEVVGLPDKVLEISAGFYHSCAITDNGKLYTWGNNSCGQLGLGKKAGKMVCAPAKVDSLNDMFVKMVALGSEHAIALTDSGDVLSWGAAGAGRLGHSSHQSTFFGLSFMSSSEYTPRLIKSFEGIKVDKVAAGMLHSACIDDQGAVYIFGESMDSKMFGRVRSDLSVPLVVGELPASSGIACGGYHTCVVTNDGDLYVWGSSENGCLGLGSVDRIHNPEKVECSHFQFSISEVSCGWKHTAAIAGGHLFTWGWGGASGTFFEEEHSSGGQLGHGDDAEYFQPTAVRIGADVRAMRVSCGFNHTGSIFEYCEV